MPKQIEELPLVGIQLDTKSEIALYKQLYSRIREAILSGRLKKGSKLPGTRTLSGELKISRNTVVLAFEQLMIEGYITGKIGAGTYVTNDIPDNLLKSRTVGIKNKIKLPKRDLEKKFGPPEIIYRNIHYDEIVPFQNGLPSLEDFPFKQWLQIINKPETIMPQDQFGYQDSTGYKPLRAAISNYLTSYRAVNCVPEQIIIINGSQQGLDLISRVMLDENKNVLIEDPGYFGTRASVFSAKVKVHPVPVDDEGIDIEYASKNYPVPNFIYTTPSHQYPLGAIMSISRRLKLLEFANETGAWIIEDDYDSEFRYSGSPLPSLQGMDEFGRVIYIGTFSKVLFPGLRLGYMVLPSEEMVKSFAVAKSIIDRQSPALEQVIVSKFIEQGNFTRHIRKMRMLYKERQNYLIEELQKETGDFLKVKPSDSGMHLVAWLPKKFNDKKFSEFAKKNQLIVYPLSEYALKFKPDPGLILGYTGFNKSKLKRGVKILKEVINGFSY